MDRIRELWLALNRPAPAAFQRELRKRGLTGEAPRDDSAKQLFAPAPRYKGHVYSTGPFSKVFLDIMVLDGQYYLVAQEEFSRRTLVEPIDSPMDAASGLDRMILLKARPPTEVVTDADHAFQTPDFRAWLTRHGVRHVLKAGKQDLATVDRAIGVIKRAVAEHEAAGTPAGVRKVVEGMNQRGAPALLGASPNEVLRGDKVAIFERLWDESNNMADNARQLHARARRLTEAGAFRVYQHPRFVRRRANEPIWSRELRKVEAVDGPHVRGDDGRWHLTKEVLPVPSDSGPLLAPRPRLNPRGRRLLQRYANRAQALLRARGGTATGIAVSRAMEDVGNVRQALRLAGVSAASVAGGLARLFPDLFRAEGGRGALQLRLI